MGVPKALLPAGRGHTLLSRGLATALNSVDGHVTIVLGHDADLCRAEIKRYVKRYPQYWARVTTVENPNYQEGLSTSLRAGVKEVLRLEPAPSGLLVSLADQPAWSDQQARDLIQMFRERRAATVAVVAAENGEQRNPVVLSAVLLPELLEVTGDRGARGVLKKYEGRVQRLELGSGVWFTDADDWATYAALMRECGWLEEVTIPEFTGELSADSVRAIEEALGRDPVPLLAPGVLVVELGGKNIQVVRLEQPLSPLREQGIRTVIIGERTSPKAQLHLLRCAALWTLGSPG